MLATASSLFEEANAAQGRLSAPCVSHFSTEISNGDFQWRVPMDGSNGRRETDLAGSRRVSLVSDLNSQLFRQNRWSG